MSVYNPGNSNFKQFLEIYELQLQERKRSIVFSDFNVGLLKKKTKTEQYKQLLKQTGHKIVNKITKKHFTRQGLTRKSIFDHVSTNLNKDEFHMIYINSSLNLISQSKSRK